MRYRFMGRDGDQYVWESGRIPGDSRVEQVRCNIEWFWSYRPGRRVA
jgi:hypothetical protein